MNQNVLRVVFRTDSGIRMGSGHLMRCLTLANELRAHGAEILFISREHPGNLIARLEDASFSVCRLPAPLDQCECVDDDYAAWVGATVEQDATQTLASFKGTAYDWLVVDHYGLDERWERMLRPAVKKILVIDDLANRAHDCDVLLDQNYFGTVTDDRYSRKIPAHCKTLLGPRYALLQPDYGQFHHLYLPRDGQVHRVLVFFGANDVSDETHKVLIALSHPDLAHLVVDVVLGANHPDAEGIASLVSHRGSTTIYQNIPSLVGLMVRADLFIGAGGSTTWERMSLGLPSLVMSVAENQKEFTRMLAVDGFQFSLVHENKTSPEDWYEAIQALIKQTDELKKISQKARTLLDALGTKRLSRVMFGLKGLGINIRYARATDERLLLDWVNDPIVRKQSFNQAYITEREHAQWFSAKLGNPDCVILIGEDERGLPVGQVRFEINRDLAKAFVDISVDQSLRGLGLSSQLLSKALDTWIMLEPKFRVVAEVRDENWPSQQLFKKLNFTEVPSCRVSVKMFELINVR